MQVIKIIQTNIQNIETDINNIGYDNIKEIISYDTNKFILICKSSKSRKVQFISKSSLEL